MIRKTFLRISAAIVSTVMLASPGYAQAPAANPGMTPPDFKVEIVGFVVAEFTARVSAYYELRRGLEEGLPPLTATADARALTVAELALARRIRAARRDARQGDLFSPAVSGEFRRVLLLETDASTWYSIMDDNPGEVRNRINGRYPKGSPRSTVPPNILAVLPALPADLEYRFLGRHLVLHDRRANVILDRIPYAIRCTDCVR